ncbi:hypothetical protein D3C75_253870 [compost metagenome]
MKLEEELRGALASHSMEWRASEELKENIMRETFGKNRRMRPGKWAVAGILAAVLLLPTGVYAGYHYLADSVYGSQKQFQQLGGTLAQYEELESKLQAAKASLQSAEFDRLQSLLHELGKYNAKIADSGGLLHPDRLSSGEQKEYEDLTSKLQPLFAKMNTGGQTAGAGESVDYREFLDGLLDTAQQKLGAEDLAKVKEIVSELKQLQEKGIAPDGTFHPEKLSVKDSLEGVKLMKELEPYFKDLGIMVKPAQ